jgi:CRISPR-associated protein Cmr4
MTKQEETQRAAMFFVRALTPVHIGVDIGLGAVNLPTMREAITRHPVIPGSSFKGVLRDLMDLSKQTNQAAFGPDRANASEYRGGLVLSDARLLLLPIASLKGTFAWATSATVLRRFNQDLLDAGISPLSTIKPSEDVLVTTESKLVLQGNRVSLREVFAEAKKQPDVSDLAKKLGAFLWTNPEDQTFFSERFAIVPNDVFDAFARSALEIRARVAIDSERGTAEASGPWTEEHIPAETILAGLAFGRKTSWRSGEEKPQPFTAAQMLEVFQEQVGKGRGMRLGGHSGIGLGRVFLTSTVAP